MTQTSIRILVVCTGNICRSPFAEAVLRQRLESLLPGVFHLQSAGTRALVGEPATEETLAEMSKAGVPIEAHHAQQATETLLGQADLILALSREHRSQILELAPNLLRRVFTIREFARLLSALDIATLETLTLSNFGGLLTVAAAQRTAVKAAHANEDDVVDPFRNGEAEYAEMAQNILEAATCIVDFVRHIQDLENRGSATTSAADS